MAACLPVPLLDIFCEALGTIIESGAQGLSLFEGAKSGIETLSAAAAQRKERVKLAAALEEHEEEARLAAEAEKYQSLAGEEGARATAEEGEADAAAVEAGEEERIGEERSAESEREEALAAVDQEVRKSWRKPIFLERHPPHCRFPPSASGGALRQSRAGREPRPGGGVPCRHRPGRIGGAPGGEHERRTGIPRRAGRGRSRRGRGGAHLTTVRGAWPSRLRVDAARGRHRDRRRVRRGGERGDTDRGARHGQSGHGRTTAER